MKSRIEHLTELIKPLNQIIEDGKNGLCPDPWRIHEAIKTYNRLAAERTWLDGILYYLPIPVSHDTWDSDLGFETIRINLTFTEQTIISPLNQVVYAPDSPESRLTDVIRIEPLKCSFTYTPEGVGAPERMMTEQLTLNYIRQVPRLDTMAKGVNFANKALSYFEQRLRTDGFTQPDELDLNTAVHLFYTSRRPEMGVHDLDTWPTVLPEPEWMVQKAVQSDHFLKGLMEMSGDDWPMTRKLIAHVLRNQRFHIDWEPFKVTA
jgi:hypothetical protein